MRTLIIVAILSMFFIFICIWHLDNNGENNRKAELRQALNLAIEKSFDDFMIKKIYEEKDIEELMNSFNKDLLLSINSNGKIVVKLLGSDIENGILFIRVENIYENAFGNEGIVACEKALILEEY